MPPKTTATASLPTPLHLQFRQAITDLLRTPNEANRLKLSATANNLFASPISIEEVRSLNGEFQEALASSRVREAEIAAAKSATAAMQSPLKALGDQHAGILLAAHIRDAAQAAAVAQDAIADLRAFLKTAKEAAFAADLAARVQDAAAIKKHKDVVKTAAEQAENAALRAERAAQAAKNAAALAAEHARQLNSANATDAASDASSAQSSATLARLLAQQVKALVT